MNNEGINVLTCEDPAPLLMKIQAGELSRFDCWNILRLIHAGEFNCNLPQYGTITVFALCNDIEEFGRLYDQGIQMLRDNDVITPEDEEQATKESLKALKKAGKKKKKKCEKPKNEFLPKFKKTNRLN